MNRCCIKIAYKTNTGKIREHNEDYILGDRKRDIFLLADGMGGHQAGEVASKLAVKTAYQYLKDKMNPSSPPFPRTESLRDRRKGENMEGFESEIE